MMRGTLIAPTGDDLLASIGILKTLHRFDSDIAWVSLKYRRWLVRPYVTDAFTMERQFCGFLERFVKF